jgi:MtN3 and saliva related transmembrane protein
VDGITILGLIAAACTTIAFLPQVVRNWKRRSTGDLSFGAFGLFTAGVTLWLVYGLIIDNLPIIVSNSVTLVLNAINLAQIVKYRKRMSGQGRAADS